MTKRLSIIDFRSITLMHQRCTEFSVILPSKSDLTNPDLPVIRAREAIRTAEAAARLPDEIKAAFRGEAGEASKSGTRQILLFLAAIFAIYVVLGVLYESYA